MKLGIWVSILAFLISLASSILGLELISNLLVLIVSNVLLDYVYEMYIISEKTKQSLKYKDGFNSDYYDLYWGLTKSSVQLLFNIIVFIAPFFKPLVSSVIKIFFVEDGHFILIKHLLSSVLVAIIAILVGELIWIFVKKSIKNDAVFNKLMVEKGLKYTAYTKDEKKILDKLK